MSSGNLATVITSRREDISWITSEDHLIQCSVDLFRDALRTHARDTLARRESFEKLERTLTNIIGIICSLEESLLANTLSTHLEMVKSLFAQLDRIKHSGWDIQIAEQVTSYIQAQERD